MEIYMLRATLLLALIGLSLGSCELANSLGSTAKMPTIAYKQTSLVKYPSATKLGLYACGGICGAVPAKEELAFDFETTFSLQNPNDLPIPTLAMLMAVDLYPEDTIGELGAVCVSFCDPADASCSGGASKSACDAGDQKDISSWSDFADRASEGLVNLATGQEAYPENDKQRYVPALGSSDIKVVYSMGVDPMLDILSKAIGDNFTSLVSGSGDPILVPYNLNGTVWLNLPYNFGRYGLAFGPANSTWEIPVK